MNAVPAYQPAQKARRFPKWLKIALSVFGVLFVLGAIFGKSPEKTPQPVAAAPISTTTSAPTSTSPSTTPPPVDTYTVVGVVDGNTVKVTRAGIEKTVRVLGIRTAPVSGPSCFATETVTWANRILNGQEVTLQNMVDQAGTILAYVKLANGDDYSISALKAGYAKYAVESVASSAGEGLQAAETLASGAGIGLWGAPCKGTIDAPAQVDVPAVPVAPADPPPAAVQKSTTKAPAPPKTTTKAPPAPDTGGSAYYANCDAVRAAGKAPIRVGQPGYSRKLDRDGDGVACE